MIKKCLLPISAFLLFVSCSDFLEVQPTDSVPAGEVFNDKKGAQAALSGVYSILHNASVYQDVTLMPEIASDNLLHTGSKKEYRQVSDNRIFPENTFVLGLWNVHYDAINRLNNIFANIDKVHDFGEVEKSNYLGQAYFLRAYFYFNLVKFFGGVPLKTIPTTQISNESLNVGRASTNQVYELIIDDLHHAEQYFLDNVNISRVYADMGATRAMLARAYLYTQQFDSAASKAAQVMAMDYTLETTNYDKLFTDQAGNNELIWYIVFNKDIQANNSIPDWTTPDGRFELEAWSLADKTASIYNEFSDSDLRRAVTVQQKDGVSWCNKYQDLLTDKDNVIVLRLAEMYLIRAEALNEIAYVPDDEAFTLLNTIRTRAGILPLTSSQVADQQAFRLAIEKERRLELAFEGHRLFDLHRTGRADAVLPAIGNLGKANWLFPIPQAELDVNSNPDMKQNDGY